MDIIYYRNARIMNVCLEMEQGKDRLEGDKEEGNHENGGNI